MQGPDHPDSAGASAPVASTGSGGPEWPNDTPDREIGAPGSSVVESQPDDAPAEPDPAQAAPAPSAAYQPGAEPHPAEAASLFAAEPSGAESHPAEAAPALFAADQPGAQPHPAEAAPSLIAAERSAPAGSGADAAPASFTAGTATGSEQVLFGTAFTGHHSYAGQPVANPYAPPHVTQAAPTYRPPQHFPPQRPADEPRRRAGGLVAGMTVLALIVGGAAGAAGGYLVADSRSPGSSATALDAPKPAKQASTPAPAGSVEAVAQKVLPSVVQLQVRGRSSAGEGSGFVISGDGLIVTNNHVVEAAADGGEIVAVFQDGRKAKAEIVGRDPSSDLAVVRAEGVSGLTVVELGRSDDLKVGQSVVAIGSPFELSGTVTSGIVSSLRRPTRAGGENGSQATVMDAIQTDAAINPGNSGGPLVDMQGQVVGINSAIYSPRSGSGAGGSVGIGFAIPIDQARRTADEIVKTGKATQTVLGVSVRDSPDGGALISEVVSGGAGERAGLKSGDVITMLDERRIETSDALVAAVRSKAPGDKVKLVIGDGARTVEATLAGQAVEPK
ncbi:Heat shock protein HtrA [Alloactinosynnema sp. L-07]|nr:Heat shock protein HtrA [Alloactinosynnema sp. L-07]